LYYGLVPGNRDGGFGIVSEEPTVLFGYWPVIRDEVSASSAAKMSGLPVFFFGLSTFVIAVLAMVLSEDELELITLVLAALGVLLLVCSLRIRAGHHAWLPFLMFPMLGILVANLLMPLLYNSAQVHTTSWMGRVIGVLLVILALSGLRGWLWKRRNKIKMTF
jgi:cyanate permease